MCASWKTSWSGPSSSCPANISTRASCRNACCGRLAGRRRGDVLSFPAFDLTPGELPGDGGRLPTLEEVERAVIERTLRRCGGNKSEAARVLGITRKTLHARLTRYGGGSMESGPGTETPEKG